MRKLIRSIRLREEGITGIETAIILIAFVIVASVLAYVAISAGLFSTQKAKDAIYSGLNEAKSALEIKGDVYGKLNNGVLTELYFTVANSASGNPIDFTPPGSGNTTNKVVISYTDAYQMFPTVNWTLTKLNTTSTDNLLDTNELFLITVDLNCVSANATAAELPTAYHTFDLEVKPPVGAVMTIERTIPARTDTNIVNLH